LKVYEFANITPSVDVMIAQTGNFNRIHSKLKGKKLSKKLDGLKISKQKLQTSYIQIINNSIFLKKGAIYNSNNKKKATEENVYNHIICKIIKLCHIHICENHM
jgi:hypothetical protein